MDLENTLIKMEEKDFMNPMPSKTMSEKYSAIKSELTENYQKFKSCIKEKYQQLKAKVSEYFRYVLPIAIYNVKIRTKEKIRESINEYKTKPYKNPLDKLKVTDAERQKIKLDNVAFNEIF